MEAQQEKYLDAAQRVGTDICRDAVWYKDRCNWMTFSSEGFGFDQKIAFNTVDSGFYNGLSGIAFFLANLCRFSESPLFRKTAEGAIRQLLVAKNSLEPGLRLGFFTGWTGIAWTLIAAGNYLQKNEWIREGEKLTDEILKLDPAQCGMDVIDGAAGAIPALIAIYRSYPRDELHRYILRLGDHLTGLAEKNDGKYSWKTMEDAKHNLTGFAHGAAGFMNALVELYDFTKNRQYLEPVYGALEYENSFFNHEKQNWPDFRDFHEYLPVAKPENDSQEDFPLNWCHGAPGIGFSRLNAYAATGDEQFKRDFDRAVSTTIKETGLEHPMGFSYCHGTFGNAELALAGYALFATPGLREYAEKVGDFAIEHFINKDRPIPNGCGSDFPAPDFMVGNAGMGYYFLRLYNQGACPCILILEDFNHSLTKKSFYYGNRK